MENDKLYMTDDENTFKKTINSRRELFPEDLRKQWETSQPIYKIDSKGIKIMEILQHEVMSVFEQPYMKKLADIVTQKGGDILNVGYGLGFIDNAIESLRQERDIKSHTVIELNEHVAAEAKKNNKKIDLIQGDWKDIIPQLKRSFDGIVYDAYPLSFDEVHRDGIEFIKQVIASGLLKPNGILTFYVDASENLGSQFIDFLESLQLKLTSLDKVAVTTPLDCQYWEADHFLAPTIIYQPKGYEVIS